jgi:hypothetical protein
MQTKRAKKTDVDFTACACSGTNLPKLVQPSILAALSKESLHGYAIAQRLAREGAHLGAPPDHSGIYRLLRGMEKRVLPGLRAGACCRCGRCRAVFYGRAGTRHARHG